MAGALGSCVAEIGARRFEAASFGYNDSLQHSYPGIFLTQESFVNEQNREVDQAVSALTTEILKLTPLEGDELAALSVTIENAFSRLALAILAQSNKTQEECLEEALPAIAAAAA